MKILVIDDDQDLVQALCRYLKQDGYRALGATNGSEGIGLAGVVKPDLVLLDIMMPGMDGRDVCTALRSITSAPIIFLSALSAEPEILRSYDSGADAYLVKPFSMAELCARIRAILRRSPNARGMVPRRYEDERLHINLDQRWVEKNARRLELSRIEFDLLAYLIENRGQIVPHEELTQALWGRSDKSTRQHLTLYIGYLRKKLEDDPHHPQYVRARYGHGYWFSGKGDPEPARRWGQPLPES